MSIVNLAKNVKRSSCQRAILCFLIFALFAVGAWYIYSDYLHKVNFEGYPDGYDFIPSLRSRGSSKSPGSVEEQDCTIPELDPYDPEILPMLGPPPKIDCEDEYPLLFKSVQETNSLEPLKSETEFNQKLRISSCCYRTVQRPRPPGRKLDERQITSAQCYPVSLVNDTRVPPEHEFIALFCKKRVTRGFRAYTTEYLQDVHAFVNLKSFKSCDMDSTNPSRYNVLILGMDAVSRMNFQRAFPQSYAYLTNNSDSLGTLELLGYNKVSSNTYPNLMPMLSSFKPSELSCNRHSMDPCPYIWKDYDARGYYTGLIEDGPHISIFSHENPGFIYQPTDYYPRPLLILSAIKLKQFHQTTVPLCYGPRLGFQFMLDYMEKFVWRMREKRMCFFYYSWTNTLTHDDVNTPKLGDKHLLKSLQWLESSGALENTVVLLMSDHGLRVGNFRNSVQGQFEDRLPVGFFLLPKSFRDKCKMAWRNMRLNRQRLVTTFDFHETLKDILHLDQLEEQTLGLRELNLMASLERDSTYPRGISLFLPVPKRRTCEKAGIETIFCSCNYLEQTSSEIPFMRELAGLAVDEINDILKKYSHGKCAKLVLSTVNIAQHAASGADGEWEGYIITFSTVPGHAMFETLVSRTKMDRDTWNQWRVQGAITRTNWYQGYSHCVRSQPEVKSFCYCLQTHR